MALASAICKAAQPRGAAGGALLTLSGGAVTRRVRQLLDDTGKPRRRRPLDALATGMVVLALGLSAALPSATLAGIAVAQHSGDAVRHCSD